MACFGSGHGSAGEKLTFSSTVGLTLSEPSAGKSAFPEAFSPFDKLPVVDFTSPDVSTGWTDSAPDRDSRFAAGSVGDSLCRCGTVWHRNGSSHDR